MTEALIDVDHIQRQRLDINAIDPDQVLRIQGYRDLERVRKRVRAAAEQATENVATCITPEVVSRTLEVQSLDTELLVLGDNTRLECPVFARYLKNSTRAIVFVMTLGESFDEFLNDQLQRDELLDAVLLESAGWMAIEALTRRFTEILRDQAGDQGLRITRRMSPGYTYVLGKQRHQWQLEQQQALFEVFADVSLPVRLLESSAMVPKMSRSGMIGLRPTA